MELVNSSISHGEQVAIVLPSAREVEMESLMRGALLMEHPAIPQLANLLKGSFFENQGIASSEFYQQIFVFSPSRSPFSILFSSI